MFNENLKFDCLNEGGIYKHKSFFDENFITKLKNECDIIYNSENLLNKIGLGNRSYRNGSLFIGNLLIKSSIFIELAVTLQKFLESNNLQNYFLSEYFIVSNKQSSDFSDWWHRDFPHTYENFDLYNKHSIGFFVPVSKYNDLTGSTKVVENSNNDISLRANDINTKTLSATKGDLIIYDPKMLHTGGANQSSDTRQLIIALFTRKELIPCENFEIQYDMIFSKYDKKIIKELNLMRHKQMKNFFGRNRSVIDTSLKPIVKIINKFRLLIKYIYALIYFSWSRSLYFLCSYNLKEI